MNYAPFFPLKRDDVDGYDMMTDLREVSRFHLKNLLLTSPGEKISNPNYGVGMKRYLFEPLNSSLTALIKSNIEIQIRSYLEYLLLEQVTVTSDEELYTINVSIQYAVPKANIRDILNVEISGYNGGMSDILKF